MAVQRKVQSPILKTHSFLRMESNNKESPIALDRFKICEALFSLLVPLARAHQDKQYTFRLV